MNGKLVLLLLILIPAGVALVFWMTKKNQPAVPAPPIAQADLPKPPAKPVKLIFIHHSTGGNWLADIGEHNFAGGLGQALQENNYFVSATNYDWMVNGDDIGSRTDIGH